VNPSATAELVGPDGHVRASVTEALVEAGWEVAAMGTTPQRLDLGVFIPTDATPASLATTSPSDWWSCISDNLTAAFHCARNLIPRLSSSAGALVFVTSLLGEIGAPNQTAFSAAAAGVIGLVKALTLDVPTVRFSAVAPALAIPDELRSSADVDLQATSVSLDATSIARATGNAVLFLANDREGHHRGQVIRIPSGITT
jgi:3-oxoacyl-[acyl-carrier protein] reductase